MRVQQPLQRRDQRAREVTALAQLYFNEATTLRRNKVIIEVK
jgi:hypothetical protein